MDHLNAIFAESDSQVLGTNGIMNADTTRIGKFLKYLITILTDHISASFATKAISGDIWLKRE